MSGFSAALRGLRGQDMEESARALLRRLEGGAAYPAAKAGTAEARTENLAGLSPVPGAEDGDKRAQAAPAAAEEEAAAEREAWRQESGQLTKRLRELSREREQAAADGGTADKEERRAAFAGPERRYENAVGGRGMEMSRVSEFFRRDSRRYDAGFPRY